MAKKPPIKPAKRTNTPFDRSKGIQRDYERQLRKIAREIGRIITGHEKSGKSVAETQNALDMYSDILRPWAETTAAEQTARVEKQEYQSWLAATQEMSIGLKKELRSTNVGAMYKRLANEQASKIVALPVEFGVRLQKLTNEAMLNSDRADEIKKEIMRSGEVAESRATMLARTSVTAAATHLTQARATQIGSEGYFWRTARDGRVRESHAEMEGKYVRWDSPPTLDKLTGHAGTIPNCRCYPEVEIPDKYTERR